MKKLYSLITLMVLLSVAFKASAQNDDGFSQLIQSNAADATKLLHAYGEPMFKGFGIGLNSGWNNTAQTKKLLHFELRLTATAAQVPTNQQSFDVTKIGLSNRVTPLNPANTIAPTFGAKNSNDGPEMSINDDHGVATGKTFTMPAGVFNYIPAPAIQLTVGLVHNTDLTIRTTPTIHISDDAGSVGMIGFGIKHDIIQDFAKGVPKPFDLALAVNYNRINYSKTLDVQPDNGTTPVAGSSTNFSNQRIGAHFSGFNIQAIISKKLLFFTPFVAVAYQTANTNLNVLGNFPLTATATTYTTVTDPVNINEKSVNGLRADAGFQMAFVGLRIYASISTGEYTSANAGIGFGF